jgi:hypothetical protein
MLFTLIGYVVFFLLVTILAIPLASIMSTMKSLITGHYLNRYYVISRKGSGVYELHCSPALGYYYAKPVKFFAIRDEAICKFNASHPQSILYANTSTLRGYYAKQGIIGTPVTETRLIRIVGFLLNYFLIMRNIANYRKRNKDEWQFAHLIRRVLETDPHRYSL